VRLAQALRVPPHQLALVAVLLGAGEAGLDRQSKAQTEQLRALDVSRFGRRLGAVQASTLRRLEDAIRLHLAV